jgi:hydrogenase-1 operon protein HyaE
MYSPLIEKMIDHNSYPIVSQDSLDAFAKTHEFTVLFFSENPKNFPESNDVAVILPELMQAFGGRIQVGVVDREHERPLQARFRFRTFPALVFLKNGSYLDVITKVKNWSEYTEEVQRILELESSEPPAFDLSATCPGATG